jgi:hypothetical protein
MEQKKNSLWPTYSLLGNDRETNNETTAVAKQRPGLQWTGWKVMFSARSAPMAAQTAVDTATEKLCSLCYPCLYVVSRTVS